MSFQLLKAAVTNVPPLTRSLVASTIVLSTSAYLYLYRQNLKADPDDTAMAQSVCPAIGLVPGFAFYTPWTFLTATFYETNIASLCFSVVVLLICGKYLERIWGSKELLKYILITGILSNAVTWLSIMLTFAITRDESLLYSMQISGMSGVFAAFLVAYKRVIPEHRIQLGGAITIRVKNLLGVATAVSILSLILFRAVVFYNLVNLGWMIGWTYIRFFQVHDNVRGDRSDAFALVTFFPKFLESILGPIFGMLFNVFVRLHICKPWTDRDMHELEEGVSTHSPHPPGSARAEADRRRALALKALDKRLGTNDNPSPTVLYDADEKDRTSPSKTPIPAPTESVDISEVAKHD